MEIFNWRANILLIMIIIEGWFWHQPALSQRSHPISYEAVGYPSNTATEAYFVFDYPPNPETFTIKLNDPQKIARAREILSRNQPSQHILGKVIKVPESYNPPWSYHLEPESIIFFDYAIEVCDASIIGVEQNLDAVCGSFLPGCIWCPWRSRLIEEVKPPVEETPRLYLPLISR